MIVYNYIYIASPQPSYTGAYIGSTLTLNYTDAQLFCQTEYGTDLATIMSDKDNQLVRVATTAADAALSTDRIWIGLNDIDEEGNWCTWNDDTEISVKGSNSNCTDGNYTNWYTDEPNDADDNEDCAEINSDYGDAWNDMPCTNEFYFACNCDWYIPVSSESLSWQDANAYCQTKYGTTLATMTSERDNQCAYQMAYHMTEGAMNVWIGIYYDGSKWVDAKNGDALIYTSWNSGQPDGTTTNMDQCGEFDGNGVFWKSWDAVSCSNLQYFLCNNDNPEYIPPTNAPTAYPTVVPSTSTNAPSTIPSMNS